MKSALRGENTSAVEVTNISRHGFWLLFGDRELFLPFKTFPWFQEAQVREILKVKLEGPEYLRWPDLDVDLTVESIEHPERFPLVSRVMPNKRQHPGRPVRRRRVVRRKIGA